MESGKVGGVGKTACILIALAIFLPVMSSAQTLELSDISVSPNSVWVNDDYHIRFMTKCVYSGSPISNGDVKAEIYPPGFNSPTLSPVLPYNPSSGSYDYTIDSILNDVGTYTVKFICNYMGQSTSTARQFSIHNIDLSIAKPDSRKFETFRGGQLTIPVVFRQDNQLVIPSQNTFNVKVNGLKLKQVSVPQIKNGQQNIVVEIPLDDSDVRDSIYTLEVTGYSQGESITASEKDGIVINAPLNIKLLNKEVICPKGTSCKAVVDAQVLFYDGYISDFTLDNFEAVISGGMDSGKIIEISNVSCDDTTRTCHISLNIPSNLESESYDLFVTVAYPSISSYSYRSQDSLSLSTIIRLTGTMQDSRGNAVDTMITFTSADGSNDKIIQTRGAGKYTLDLLPGVYDAEVKFSTGVVARYYNCQVSVDNLALLAGNAIRYDTGAVNGGALEGLNPVATNVIEFSLPFDRAWIMAPYDSSRVMGDERNLQVFFCRNWNFMKSSCTGHWEILPAKIHTIEDVAEFQTNSSGAFIVGEAKQIHFSGITVPSKDYALSEVVDVNGKVLDMDGNYVEGATVIAVFPGENKSIRTITSRDGKFALTISSPTSDGVSDLLLKVEKDPYVGESYKTSINVVRKKELSILNVPDIVEVELNKNQKLEFSVFNSGQVNFTEPVNVHFSGVPSSWYVLSPERINGMGVGEKKIVQVDFRLTDATCGKDCNPYNLVTVDVKSGDYSQGVSFSLRVTSPVNQTEATIEAPGLITGFMTGINSSSLVGGSLVYVLLIAVIAVLVVLIYLKKNKGVRMGPGGRGGGGQYSGRNSLIAPATKSTSLGSAGPRRDEINGSRISKLYKIKEQLDTTNNRGK